MKKKTTFLFAIIIQILFFISCDNEQVQGQKEDVLIPLKTGNTWVYRATHYPIGSLNTDTTSNNTGLSIDTVKTFVGDRVTINGISGYAFCADIIDHVAFLVSNDNDGNYLSIGGVSDTDTLISSTITFRIKANAGEQWDSFANVYYSNEGEFGKEKTTVKCLSIDTIISTSMKDFHCKLYEESIFGGAGIARYFISLNVGFVRIERYNRWGILFSKQELIEYKLFD